MESGKWKIENDAKRQNNPLGLLIFVGRCVSACIESADLQPELRRSDTKDMSPLRGLAALATLYTGADAPVYKNISPNGANDKRLLSIYNS